MVNGEYKAPIDFCCLASKAYKRYISFFHGKKNNKPEEGCNRGSIGILSPVP
jgi:hypothetical protein